MSSRWSERLHRRFTLRLGLWYAGLFVVSALTVAVLTYVLLARALVAQDHDTLDAMLARYVVEYEQGGLLALQRLIDADAGEGRHERLLVRVVTQDSEVVYFAEPPGWSAFDLAALDRLPAGSRGPTTIASPVDAAVLDVVSAPVRDGVTIQVGRSSHVRDELLGHFRARALEVMTLVALIAVAGGVLLTSAVLAPLRALERTLRSILQTGRFDARVPTRDSRDPLDELGCLVNEMLGRIQSLIGGMRGALDNVAHDLRTPLTRFRSTAERALLEGDTAGVRDGLGEALEEADRVNATLTALMDISEAETGTMRLTLERLRLAEVAHDAVALHADEAEEKGVDLQSTIAPDLEVTADRTRLRQVLANLVENAVKYTPGGGQVRVEAHAGGHGATIVVRDTGIGIAPDDLPFVWDRLYRADASRSTRGLGLGLSLVKAVVEAHGGRVAVTSASGQGSVFSVTLPARDVVSAGGVR
jgi:signal transduction histidine kinase